MIWGCPILANLQINPNQRKPTCEVDLLKQNKCRPAATTLLGGWWNTAVSTSTTHCSGLNVILKGRLEALKPLKLQIFWKFLQCLHLPTTSNHFQPLPTTSNHFQPLPTTSNHFQPLPTTANDLPNSQSTNSYDIKAVDTTPESIRYTFPSPNLTLQPSLQPSQPSIARSHPQNGEGESEAQERLQRPLRMHRLRAPPGGHEVDHAAQGTSENFNIRKSWDQWDLRIYIYQTYPAITVSEFIYNYISSIVYIHLNL